MFRFFLALLRRFHVPESDVDAIDKAPTAFFVTVVAAVVLLGGVEWVVMGWLRAPRETGSVAAAHRPRRLDDQQKAVLAGAFRRLPQFNLSIEKCASAECGAYADDFADVVRRTGGTAGADVPKYPYNQQLLPKDETVFIITTPEAADILKPAFAAAQVVAQFETSRNGAATATMYIGYVEEGR